MTRYLRIKDVARIVNVNEFTIRRAIERGDLEAVRVGRVIRVSETAFKRFLIPVNTKRDGK